jgi:hypothetical protein
MSQLLLRMLTRRPGSFAEVHWLNALKAAAGTTPNNGMVVTGGGTALHPNCQGFVGNAFVSVHLRPVSTPSLCSVGHSSQAHGTQAQYKLATSPCRNVVCNCKPLKTEERAQDRNMNEIALQHKGKNSSDQHLYADMQTYIY